jgi:hypothetical protein
MLALPNLFVLGAGKCGTTTLHNTLATHPLVHMSAVKEPSFFCSHFQVTKDPVSYISLFQTDRAVIHRGESSHVYLSNPETPPILRRLFPEARFVVTLRHPARRAYALYQHMRRHDLEPEATFLSALLAERKDRQESCAHLPHYAWNFRYVGSSRYDIQLERYLRLFGRSSFHFMSLADIAERPLTTLEKLCTFLEVPVTNGFTWCVPANRAPAYAPPTPAAAAILEEGLAGVPERVETLIGEKLDWSL